MLIVTSTETKYDQRQLPLNNRPTYIGWKIRASNCGHRLIFFLFKFYCGPGQAARWLANCFQLCTPSCNSLMLECSIWVAIDLGRRAYSETENRYPSALSDQVILIAGPWFFWLDRCRYTTLRGRTFLSKGTFIRFCQSPYFSTGTGTGTTKVF